MQGSTAPARLRHVLACGCLPLSTQHLCPPLTPTLSPPPSRKPRTGQPQPEAKKCSFFRFCFPTSSSPRGSWRRLPASQSFQRTSLLPPKQRACSYAAAAALAADDARCGADQGRRARRTGGAGAAGEALRLLRPQRAARPPGVRQPGLDAAPRPACRLGRGARRSCTLLRSTSSSISPPLTSFFVTGFSCGSPSPPLQVPLNSELDILDARLHELDPVVDHVCGASRECCAHCFVVVVLSAPKLIPCSMPQFVIVEAPYTFSGKRKPLHYNENKERFAAFHSKIVHVIVPDFEAPAGVTDVQVRLPMQPIPPPPRLDTALLPSITKQPPTSALNRSWRGYARLWPRAPPCAGWRRPTPATSSSPRTLTRSRAWRSSMHSR